MKFKPPVPLTVTIFGNRVFGGRWNPEEVVLCEGGSEVQLMPERCYRNPGSCSRSRRMIFGNTRAASKQSLYCRKANSSQDSWEGDEESPSLLSYRGFYPLKMGLPMWGPEICCFLPLALPNYLYQFLSNRNLRGGNVR